jgi:hypothetical protein
MIAAEKIFIKKIEKKNTKKKTHLNDSCLLLKKRDGTAGEHDESMRQQYLQGNKPIT